MLLLSWLQHLPCLLRAYRARRQVTRCSKRVRRKASLALPATLPDIRCTTRRTTRRPRRRPAPARRITLQVKPPARAPSQRPARAQSQGTEVQGTEIQVLADITARGT